MIGNVKIHSLAIKLLAVGSLALSLGLGLASTPTTFAAARPLSVGPVVRTHLHVVSPDYYYCEPGWVYDSVSNQGRQMAQVFPTQADYNGTPYNETVTLSASTTATVGVTWSGGGSLDGGVIVAGVQVSINASVTISISVSGTNTVQMTVPPYKTGYGQYGVWRQVAYGHYYYLTQRCGVGTDYGWRTTYSPWYVGWNTWIG